MSPWRKSHPSLLLVSVINFWYLQNKVSGTFRWDGRWEVKWPSSNRPHGVLPGALGNGHAQKSCALPLEGQVVRVRPLESSNSSHLRKSGRFFIYHVDYWVWNESFQQWVNILDSVDPFLALCGGVVALSMEKVGHSRPRWTVRKGTQWMTHIH